MKETIYLVIGLLVVIVLILSLIGFLFFKSRTESNVFRGNLSRVEADSIFVDGRYFIEDKKTYLPEGEESIAGEVIITSATKFKRVALIIPSQSELEKTGGRFNTEDLGKEIREADFETFKKDALGPSPIGLEVKSAQNIFNKTRFEAEEITYRLAVYSK